MPHPSTPRRTRVGIFRPSIAASPVFLDLNPHPLKFAKGAAPGLFKRFLKWALIIGRLRKPDL